MRHEDWLAALEREGRAFGVAAERAGLAAPVPSCPGWSVADLVTHLGNVHRWVTDHVARGVTDPYPFQARTPDPDLLAWYRAGLAALSDLLARTDPALPAWNFTPTAPQRAGFWARRQAHETAVHRWDAELAGGQPTGFDPALAADGVGEVADSMFPRLARRRRLTARGRVRLDCTDTGDGWLVTLAPDGVATTRLAGAEDPADPTGSTDPAAPADATIAGPAGQLYLVVWGRREVGTVTVTGDADLAALVHSR